MAMSTYAIAAKRRGREAFPRSAPARKSKSGRALPKRKSPDRALERARRAQPDGPAPRV